jgi:hypothetical protein
MMNFLGFLSKAEGARLSHYSFGEIAAIYLVVNLLPVTQKSMLKPSTSAFGYPVRRISTRGLGPTSGSQNRHARRKSSSRI